MDTFFAKFKKSFNNTVSKKRNLNPHHYWMLLLRIFFIISIILIVFSFYLLFKIKKEEIFSINPQAEGKPIIVREDLLKKTTEQFDAKSKKTDELIAQPLSYPDPGQF
jgi:hypothetical protein